MPLLERMSFLGIYSNNLDEFFRVRMASQSRIAECTDRSAARESEHAKKVIKQINKLNAQYAKAYSKAVDEVTEALRRENIFLVTDTELTPEQQDFIHDYYHSKLSGLIVPVWFSAIKMLDYENDEDIYLAVKVTRHEPKTVSDYAFLELPVAQCGRFVRLPDHEGRAT